MITERILVPLDGSARAEAALPQVERLLRNGESEILLVRAVMPPSVDAWPTVFDTTLEDARQYLSEPERRLASRGFRVRSIARMGSPAEVIFEVARAERATLIVLTTHGRSGMVRSIVGSVSEEVLRAGQFPALVTRVQESPPAPQSPTGGFGRILVPLDGSEPGLAALGPAIEFARLFQARMVLAHVLDPLTGPDAEARGGPALRELALVADRNIAERHLQAAAERARHEGIKTATILEAGEPVRTILEICRFQRADLIALSSHGRTGLSRALMGSVAEGVIRKAHVPLLVVRSVEAAPARVLEEIREESR